MGPTNTTDAAGEAGDEVFPHSEKQEGPISASVIAAGIGCAALGLLTTLAAASTSVADALAWSDAVGPLSGKTSLAVAVWLLAWVVLHAMLRNKRYETTRALAIGLVFIALGVLGTFPEFFQLFS